MFSYRVKVGSLGPVENGGSHGGGLAVITVDGEFAHEQEVCCFGFGDLGGHFGDLEGSQSVQLSLVNLKMRIYEHQRAVMSDYSDVDASIAAHSERSSKSLGRLLRADGEGDDLLGDLLLLESDGLLDGDFAEGIHRVLD